MKAIKLIVMILILSISSSYAENFREHGGRNGGDGLELEVELIAKKIVAFLGTDLGQKQFPEIKLEYLKEILKETTFTMDDNPTKDKYGVPRTCTNSPEESDIICNTERWIMTKEPAVYYPLVMHELLGLMKVELGYKEDVSSYPISGRLVLFVNLVEEMNIEGSEKNQEYLSTKKMSRGLTVVNRSTGEELKVICVDDSEVHKCEKFMVVREYRNNQSLVVKEVETVTASMMNQMTAQLETLLGKRSLRRKHREIVKTTIELINAKGQFSLMGQVVEPRRSVYKAIDELLTIRLQDFIK